MAKFYPFSPSFTAWICQVEYDRKEAGETGCGGMVESVREKCNNDSLPETNIQFQQACSLETSHTLKSHELLFEKVISLYGTVISYTRHSGGGMQDEIGIL